MAASTTNNNEWYTVQCGSFLHRLPVRYQDPVHIGQGAFGAVIRAKDTVTGKDVAIKKMLQPFATSTHAQRTHRKLKLLVHLNHPDAQVVQLYNMFIPEKTLAEFQTLYFVFNYAGSTLDRVIRKNQVFSEEHVKLIIYSLLRGLKFMHSAGVIHRDLKPQNIGIDRDANITILGLGSASVASDGVQTGYVSTQWWRAPDVYINSEQYNEKLDIWSVGCIMAELILLRTAFRGSDHIDQLNKIFDIIGTPNLTTLTEICTAETSAYISTLPTKLKQDFDKLFGFKYEAGSRTPTSGVSPQGVDLLDRLLSFDHRLRPTAEEVLTYPFFESLHDPMDEPTAELFVDEHQAVVHPIAMWKCE